MSQLIWFVQAFCWVLAATGLLVAALESERRRAEAAIAIERERSLEVSLREERAQLDALRYQLNPHFLFNSLNSIYSTLPATGAEIPGRMLVQLSSYRRSTLDSHNDHTVLLREEIISMEQYLAIEKSRFGDDLNITRLPAAQMVWAPTRLASQASVHLSTRWHCRDASIFLQRILRRRRDDAPGHRLSGRA